MTKVATGACAASEWRAHWPMVLAASVGWSMQPLASYSLGLMMDPLGDEFGWSRAHISSAILIPAILMILFAPSVGAMIDQWGTRRLAIPSLALTGISLAMLAFLNGSIVQWYLLWSFYGVVSLGIITNVWTAAISSSFTAARGLALGLTVSGGAITQVLAPPLTQMFVDGYSWRVAYVALGLGWAIPAVLLSIFFLKDARDRQRLASKQSLPVSVPEVLTGLSGREALRSIPLIRVGLATLLTMLVGVAVLIHQVPILTSVGIGRSEAALLAGLAGFASFVGKIMTGWMSDRWDASLVGAILLLAPAVGYWIILYHPQNLVVVVCGMIIIGYTTGAKLQVSAYLTAQFAGLRNFGKIFGVMTSLIGIGGGLGGIAAGAVFDRFGDYEPVLILGIVLSFVCSALVFRLGRYPDWSAGAGPSNPA